MKARWCGAMVACMVARVALMMLPMSMVGCESNGAFAMLLKIGDSKFDSPWNTVCEDGPVVASCLFLLSFLAGFFPGGGSWSYCKS